MDFELKEEDFPPLPSQRKQKKDYRESALTMAALLCGTLNPLDDTEREMIMDLQEMLRVQINGY